MIKLTDLINEATSSYSKDIASMTGTRQNKVLDFIKKHKIDAKKLAQHLNKQKLSGRMDFASAVSGKAGNRYERKFARMFGESVVNEADVVGKTIFSDGKGKLVFGYYKTDDAVEFVDYKTWKKLNFKDVSKSDTNKDRLIKAILKKQKQFNKKVDFNMWSKKNNPSFEEKMDWFIKNGWISNVTKRGINESEELDKEEVKVGNYNTSHFDMCPGATSVYKDIDVEDMDMAERSAKLQDALFFIEKHVIKDNETGSADGYVLVAQNLADQIMAMAKMMGLEKEHSYIQGHVDRIKDAVSGEETMNDVNEEKEYKLNSVGTIVTDKGMTYPQIRNGKADYDMGVHIKDVDSDWFESLDDKDRKMLMKLGLIKK